MEYLRCPRWGYVAVGFDQEKFTTNKREPLPWLLFLMPFFYLILPAVAGVILGKAVASGRPWATRLIGENHAPLAWDYLFGASVRGFIRCRLKSGRWVGGYYNSEKSPYGPKSYASDDPSNLDLYIGCGLEFSQESGDPILENGKYSPTDSGILLKWEDIETLEFRQINTGDESTMPTLTMKGTHEKTKKAEEGKDYRH